VTGDPDLSLVVACFEEEEALPRLFGEIERLRALCEPRGLTLEAVLVDDGSSDATPRLLAAWREGGAGRRVETHPANRGFGAAMRTGFSAARGRTVVCYDADATYPIEDALVLVDALEGADVAGASPFAEGGEVATTPLRGLMSRAVAGLYRLAHRRDADLTVYTCAFRAYRAEALSGVEWEADDFLAAAELLSVLLARGARVVERPSKLTARIHGQSKMKVGRTALRHLRLLGGLFLRRGRFAVRPAIVAERAVPPSIESVRPVPGNLADWNADLNRAWPMQKIEDHANPVVRAIEGRRRREVLRLAAVRKGQTVLDVGSEEGAYAARLAARGARPVALDIDAGVLARARGSVPAVAADAARLPFRDRTLPRVLLAEVLEHCPDPSEAVSEALRVVTPAGRVVVSVPDDAAVLCLKSLLRRLGLARLFRGLPDGLAPGHLHVFRGDSVRRMLARRGRLLTLRRDPLALAFVGAVAPREEAR